MRYAAGGGLTAAERARREQVGLAAAELIEAGVRAPVPGVADVGTFAWNVRTVAWPGQFSVRELESQRMRWTGISAVVITGSFPSTARRSRQH